MCINLYKQNEEQQGEEKSGQPSQCLAEQWESSVRQEYFIGKWLGKKEKNWLVTELEK